jgi:2-polyprenyl-3-methyl-5-hydroxy-6-metoxy-1,4-benzoquinol methylase
MNTTHKPIDCPLCNQHADRFLDIPRSGNARHYAIHHCPSCKACFTHPFPTQDDLDRIYSGQYWARETSLRGKNAIGRTVELFNNMRLAMLIRPLLQRLPRGASVLEVGCGSGHLATHIKQCGFDIEVTDISNDILQEVQSLHNIPGYCGNIEEITFHRQYDAIIFNNVLEHLHAPDRAIATASNLLSAGGIIFIEVPNIDSYQFNFFKAKWFHLRIPQHLYHFTSESLDNIMHQFALKRTWLSTYSPRTSAAGYAASLSPSLQPAQLRRSWSLPRLFLYLMIQISVMPIVFFESLRGKGGVLRATYRKTTAIENV